MKPINATDARDSEYYVVDGGSLRRIQRKLEKLDRIAGPGVTHTPDGIVIDTPQRKRGQPQPPQGTRLIIGVVTGDAVGGGKYYGKQINPAGAGAIDVTTNLTESEIGSRAESTLVFLNLEEVGLATHVLTEGGNLPLFIGRIVGRSSENPAKTVVAGFSILSAGC